MADGLTKEAFQQGNDKYIIKERKKDISKGKATVGSSVKEQILFEESNDHKRKRDLEDRNTYRQVTGSSTSQRKKLKKSKVEGLALGIEDGKNKIFLQGHSKGCKLAMGLTAAAAFDGAKKIHDKTSSERVENYSSSFIGSANSTAQSENVLLAAVEKLCGFAISQREKKKKKKVRVEKKAVTPPDHALESLELRNEQGSGLSMSQRKKQKKVKSREHMQGEKVLNTRDHALGSHLESPNEQGSGLSMSQRKKQKKVKSGEHILGEKVLYKRDHALGSHREAPNEEVKKARLNGDTAGKEDLDLTDKALESQSKFKKE